LKPDSLIETLMNTPRHSKPVSLCISIAFGNAQYQPI
jgi:hypothetical protein